jgi:hypothetical protein
MWLRQEDRKVVMQTDGDFVDLIQLYPSAAVMYLLNTPRTRTK